MLLNKLTKLMALLLVLGMTVYGTGLLCHSLMAHQVTAPLKKTASPARAALPWPQVGPEKKTDAERIVGTWRITKGRGEGEDAPEILALARLTFSKDGNVTMTALEETKKGQFKLVGPGHIDLQLGSEKWGPGIYEFSAKTSLQFVSPPTRKTPNVPRTFAGEKGTGQLLFILSRVKPGEKKLTPQEIAKNKEMIDKYRNAMASSLSANNLHQIGLTFHHYYEAFNSLPLHAIYSKDGKTPLLSQARAHAPLSPAGVLYKEFKFDEPWDSAHNQKLIAKMPAFYATTPNVKLETGLTHYQVFTGPETLFDGTKKIQWSDIKDGLSSTIVVIEAKDPVIWSKPDDLTLPKDKDKMPAIGGLFKEGFHILVYDGSVWMLRQDTPPAMLRALVTPDGGETVDLEKLKVKEK